MGFDLEHSVSHRIAIVSSLAKRMAFRIIAESDLNITPEQWTILHYLWISDGLTIGELVKKSKKDFANVTRIIDKLIKQGYVEKIKDGQDSRSYRIYLLPMGNSIQTKIQQCQEKAMEISLQGISKNEEESILNFLNIIEQNILNEIECN